MFRRVEFQHLTVAWLVLGFSFSIHWLLYSLGAFLLMFPITLVAVGLGFICHELAHKFVAERYGCWAEFRLWATGLVLALMLALLSRGAFIYAAPGAVYIVPRVSPFSWRLGPGRKEYGYISLAGPLANMVIALAFFALQGTGGLLSLLGGTVYRINLWLAAFNMLPLGGSDGQKVLSWSLPAWAILTVPPWLLIALDWFT